MQAVDGSLEKFSTTQVIRSRPPQEVYYYINWATVLTKLMQFYLCQNQLRVQTGGGGKLGCPPSTVLNCSIYRFRFADCYRCTKISSYYFKTDIVFGAEGHCVDVWRVPEEMKQQ